MPILCTFTDTQKCQSNQSTTLPGSPCSKNSPATATTGVPSSQEVSRIRQPHQVLFPSIDFHNFPLQCLARTCPHSRVCPSVHTTHTHKSGIKSSCFERCQAVCTCKHIQQVNELEFKCSPLRAMSLRKYLQHPSASFSQISHESAHAGCLAAWQGGVSFNGFQNFVRQKPQAHE